MENFTNETIDTTQLPKFESVVFTALHPNYWKVTLVSLCLVFVVLWVAIGFLVSADPKFSENIPEFLIGGVLLTLLTLILSRIAFRKKGFAFRNHDVLYRNGIIATNTIVIPYNRVQHVSLHEGIVSRWFGLAKVEIFTAGGKDSDIEIPGIEKSQAENIQQLLMGKIQKQL